MRVRKEDLNVISFLWLQLKKWSTKPTRLLLTAITMGILQHRLSRVIIKKIAACTPLRRKKKEKNIP